MLPIKDVVLFFVFSDKRLISGVNWVKTLVHYMVSQSLGLPPYWPQTSARDNSWNGFHHVAGWSPEAVHQLHVGEKRHHQERGQEEPVCPQKQLHPQEECQQEEKPPLRQPESPGLVAPNIPGWTEERKVGWLTRADPHRSIHGRKTQWWLCLNCC